MTDPQEKPHPEEEIHIDDPQPALPVDPPAELRPGDEDPGVEGSE